MPDGHSVQIGDDADDDENVVRAPRTHGRMLVFVVDRRRSSGGLSRPTVPLRPRPRKHAQTGRQEMEVIGQAEAAVDSSIDTDEMKAALGAQVET